MRQKIRQELQTISPLDALEERHLQESLTWIDSGVALCRTAKPATPAKHLVAYFVLIDSDSLLLVDHKKAELWLPTGGHVEPSEHPRQTVLREAKEELGIVAKFLTETPLMLTCTTTVGATAGHIDISLWYLLKGDKSASLNYNLDEFKSIRWFDLDTIPYTCSDPHMARFVSKLKALPGLYKS